jgi:hypothetical protein
MDGCQNLFEFGDTLAACVCYSKFLQFVAQTLRSARGDVISRARRQSRRRSLPSAALRKIHIFFDERSAHSKEYRTSVSFSVSDFAQPMSNGRLANGAYGKSDIGVKLRGSSERAGTRASFNGADRISNIEGKAVMGSGEQAGTRENWGRSEFQTSGSE